MSDIGRELFRISDDFASLCQLREILASEGEDTAPIETAIRQYISADVTREKIDGVIGYLRYCEEMAELARTEIERLECLADRWSSQREYLKDCAKSVLESSGQKRLEGKTAGYIAIQKNGGKQAVEITDASLIPEELVQYEGRISGAAWAALQTFGLHWYKWEQREDVQMQRVPMIGKIGAALAEKCEVCNGIGAPWNNSASVPCDVCGGDGLARVPGARLVPRGSHVVIR